MRIAELAWVQIWIYLSPHNLIKQGRRAVPNVLTDTWSREVWPIPKCRSVNIDVIFLTIGAKQGENRGFVRREGAVGEHCEVGDEKREEVSLDCKKNFWG